MNSHKLPKDQRNEEETTNPGVQFQLYHFLSVWFQVNNLRQMPQAQGTYNTSKSHLTSYRNLQPSPIPSNILKSRILIEYYSKLTIHLAQHYSFWKKFKNIEATRSRKKFPLNPQHYCLAWKPLQNFPPLTQIFNSSVCDINIQ